MNISCSVQLVALLFVTLFAQIAHAENLYDVALFGAVGDGKTINTEAIQTALNKCGKSGGGVVLIPPGVYLSAPLVIRDKTPIRIDTGATLKAVDDPAGFTRTDKPDTFNHFLTGKELENVTFEGGGTIDGSGQR
jgi:polygalacturonase